MSACRWIHREGWSLVEAGLPLGDHASTCLTCRQTLERQRIVARLFERSDEVSGPVRAPVNFEARVWARIAAAEAPRPSWLSRIVWPVFAIAALALLWWLPTAPPAGPLALSTEIRAGGRAHRTRGAAAGDVVIARVNLRTGVELRVYRNDERLASCSTSSPCRRVGGGVVMEFTLPGPGRYRFVAVTAPGPLPASTGQYDLDAAKVAEVGGRMVAADLVEAW